MLLGLAASAASAHDTWFEQRPTMAPAAVDLILGTGTTYPIFDSGIDVQYIVDRGCRAAAPAKATATAASAAAPPGPGLTALGNEPPLLLLNLRTTAAARTCWAQLQPFELKLVPEKIPVYLDEIRASSALRATWATIAAKGLPWIESYTKNARIELGTPSAEPAPLSMDLLLEGATRPVQVGDTLNFRVLHDGKPLAGQPIELRGDRLPFGIWRTTDAEGRASVPAPSAGHWILRGVDLRLSAARPDTWVSRFVTLSFDVAPKSP
ncbi:MAG: DUF4198 domain-containing protein [Rubrivivax sp.]